MERERMGAGKEGVGEGDRRGVLRREQMGEENREYPCFPPGCPLIPSCIGCFLHDVVLEILCCL
eukprot:403242-Hanusia_phi.AAC.1